MSGPPGMPGTTSRGRSCPTARRGVRRRLTASGPRKGLLVILAVIPPGATLQTRRNQTDGTTNLTSENDTMWYPMTALKRLIIARAQVRGALSVTGSLSTAKVVPPMVRRPAPSGPLPAPVPIRHNSLLSSRPALRPCGDAAVTGCWPYPPSRWNHTHQAFGETEPRGPGRASSLRIRPATSQAVHYRRTAVDNPMLNDPQPGPARRALGLGSLLRREILSPVGMLPGLRSQWATLISELPVHARDVLLGSATASADSGDLLAQRLALLLRLLGSLQGIGAVGIRVGHLDRYPPRCSPTDTQPDRVAGATSGPHPTRIPRATPGNDGRSTSQFRSPWRPASQVVSPPRFSLARRKSGPHPQDRLQCSGAVGG